MREHLNTRGSVWRKWDLHIHAPGTALNDQYKEDWDAYIYALENLKDISVLGITDYYGIEGYLKVKEAKENGLLKNIELIIPNVEMRLDIYTKEGKPVNYHILFSPEVDAFIESHFLSELVFRYDKRSYKCTKDELIKLGETLLGKEASEEKRYEEGIKQFKVSINDITRILEEHNEIFKGKYLLAVSNKSTDGASGIRVEQYRGVKENIYKTSHVIFSSNPKDKEYFTSGKKDALDLCGKLMPCIHGSDAHSLDKIGKPDENRYTWIKADPTFEGLKQIIHEPKNRAVVQQDHPDNKIDYNVIEKVQFLDGDDGFTTDPIYLNPDLNVIIGGKSSGKSALLYKIAEAISLDEINMVKENNSWSNIYEGTFIETTGFKVTYRNNEVFTKEDTSGRIQYIPQMYINEISEDPSNKKLQRKIKEVLETNISDRNEFLRVNEVVEQNNQEIRMQVDLLIEQIALVIEAKKQVLEFPKEEVVMEEIKKIEKKINDAIIAAKLTDEEMDKYNDITETIKEKEKALSENQLQTQAHNTNLKELSSIVDKTVSDLKGITFNDEKSRDVFKRFTSSLETSKHTTFKDLEQIGKRYEEANKTINKEIGQLKIESKPIEGKLQKSNTVPEDRNKLAKQTEVLTQIKKAKEKYDEEIRTLREIEEKVFYFKNKQIHFFNKIIDLIRSTTISSNLSAFAKINFDNQYFDNTFLDLFHRRGKINNILKNPDEKEIITDMDELAFVEETYVEDIKYLYNTILEHSEEELKLKNGVDKRKLLEGLLKESYISVQYDLIKDNDSLYQMSPGNRGLVLLELFLHMSEELYPILIDQPEDNLDNRTISKELVKIIREQKKQRQIIIVTHNANLAILTDAENIIVANQDHSLEYNLKNRFEYITGSLECSFIEGDGKKFNDQGIKEHASEILEGGEEAFEVRGRKYGYK